MPTQRESAPSATAAAPAQAAVFQGPLRIVIVEDNRDTADSLAVLLKLFGHLVEVAYTGPEGVEAAVRHAPDVVLSDIGLPGLDGWAVAREVRRHPATAQSLLIAITAYGTDDVRDQAREAGFNYLLTKPADPDVLLQLLAS